MGTSGGSRASLRSPCSPSSILRTFMPDNVFVPGMATAIGSLPHQRCRRGRGARAAMHSRASRRAAASESLASRRDDRRNGRVRSTASTSRPTDRSRCAPISTSVPMSTRPSTRSRTADCSRSSHAAEAQPVPPKRVKVQCAGPLTLGGGADRRGCRLRHRVRARCACRTAVEPRARGSRREPPSRRGSARVVLRRARVGAVGHHSRARRRSRRPRDRDRSVVERARRADLPHRRARVRPGRPAAGARRRPAPGALRRRRARPRRRGAAVALPRGRRLGRSGARFRPTGRSASTRRRFGSAARHVVRADASRLRPVRSSGRRRWSHRRAVSRVTA